MLVGKLIPSEFLFYLQAVDTESVCLHGSSSENLISLSAETCKFRPSSLSLPSDLDES